MSTKRLNEQVKRNAERFPEDFAFELTEKEATNLRSQFATSRSHGGRRYLPRAFTEHGALMAANVLNSKQAVEMSVFVVRAFVKLRDTIAGHKELGVKIDELDRRVGSHDNMIKRLLRSSLQFDS